MSTNTDSRPILPEEARLPLDVVVHLFRCPSCKLQAAVPGLCMFCEYTQRQAEQKAKEKS